MIRDSLLIIFDTTTPVKKHIVKVSSRIALSLLPDHLDTTRHPTSHCIISDKGTDQHSTQTKVNQDGRRLRHWRIAWLLAAGPASWQIRSSSRSSFGMSVEMQLGSTQHTSGQISRHLTDDARHGDIVIRAQVTLLGDMRHHPRKGWEHEMALTRRVMAGTRSNRQSIEHAD